MTKPKSQPAKSKIIQQQSGRVIKIIDPKTAKVEVTRIKVHPIYQKRSTRHKTYLVETSEPLKIGDPVLIESCRPLSKRKKWKVKK